MRLAFLTFLVLLFSSCGLYSKAEKIPQPIQKFDLISFSSKGKSGILGDSTITHFSYNFKIGEAEITQEEFLNVLGYNPNRTEERSLKNPVTMVSWYEAILFCNALSKIKGYDTIYTYSNAQFGSDGNSVISLDGLSANYSRDGFRLPTEAEWEFAARTESGNLYVWGQSSDTSQAILTSWFQLNSGDSTHPVCSRDQANELCDMSGNAMEWVDGWFSEIPKDSITDYIGSLQPGSSMFRTVKGGSYLSSLAELKLTRRIDVYGTYSATRTEYIGFRIAQGIIPSPQYSQSGSVVERMGTPLNLLVSRETLREFLGTTLVKMVMVNGTNDYLANIDFSQSPLLLREFPSSETPRHPTISPDGKTISFGTRSEGQTGSSSIYTRPFDDPLAPITLVTEGFIPRWYIDTTQGDTLLLYTSDATSNKDSLQWSSGVTYAQLMQAGNASGSAKTITTSGAFHDGMSTNGRYLITGFTDLRMKDIEKDSTIPLFRYPENGKTSSASFQACNASISPSKQSLIAFLDFGFSGKSTIIGKAYESHEYAFIMDPMTRKVVDTIRVPSPWKSWDHLEWSNHPDYLVATVTDESDLHRALYLIRASDHRVLKIAEGDDIWMPYLWITTSETKNPSPDSLLQYASPAEHDIPFYGAQLTRFLQNRNYTQLIAFGSSRTSNGVDVSYLPSNLSPINMGTSGAEIWLLRDTWLHYIKPKAIKLRYIVLEISLDFLYYTPEEKFIPGYAYNYGRVYDSIHGLWNTPLPLQYDDWVDESPVSLLPDIYSPQGVVLSEPLNIDVADLSHSTITGYKTHPKTWKTSLDSLVSMIKDMDSSGLKVIGVIFPHHPGYATLGMFGKYGPELASADTIFQDLVLKTNDIQNFKLLDEYNFGNNDYELKHIADYDHLSREGARKITLQIDSLIQNW